MTTNRRSFDQTELRASLRSTMRSHDRVRSTRTLHFCFAIKRASAADESRTPGGAKATAAPLIKDAKITSPVSDPLTATRSPGFRPQACAHEAARDRRAACVMTAARVSLENPDVSSTHATLSAASGCATCTPAPRRSRRSIRTTCTPSPANLRSVRRSDNTTLILAVRLRGMRSEVAGSCGNHANAPPAFSAPSMPAIIDAEKSHPMPTSFSGPRSSLRSRSEMLLALASSSS